MSIMLDNDVLEVLDFEHATPCDGPECDAAATWRLVTSCCGSAWLMCDWHKRGELAYMEWAAKEQRFMTCKACHKTIPAANRFILVEPIT